MGMTPNVVWEIVREAFTLAAVMAPNSNGTKGKDSPKTWDRALGRHLADFRMMRGYSQREMARRVSVVQVEVSDYEVGKLRLLRRDGFSFRCRS